MGIDGIRPVYSPIFRHLNRRSRTWIFTNELGVRRLLWECHANHAGGSLMPPRGAGCHGAAAQYFVDLDELQDKVGKKIAEWTHNEAAYVFLRGGCRDGIEHCGLHHRVEC